MKALRFFDGEIVQLTWQENRGFVYNQHTFALLREFSYSSEGWGITHNGSHLIMSDGTAILRYFDPDTFEMVGQVEVRDEEGPVMRLNELEFINGEVFANVLTEFRIARINPETGHVTGWIDLSGIIDNKNLGPDDVLNGIAYDAENNRIFVTGKRWPQLCEIKLVLLEP